MRWLFLILTFVCTGIAFTTTSSGTLGLCMLLALLFGFLAVLGFAQARIEAGSQSHASMITSTDVQAIRQQGLQKKVMQNKVRQQGAVGGGAAGMSFDSASSGGSSHRHDHHGDGNDGGGGSDGGGSD